MAITETTEYPPLTTLTRTEVENLADRLFSRGVSTLSAIGPLQRQDLVLASRALRRLLVTYESSTGHQLNTIMISGGV